MSDHITFIGPWRKGTKEEIAELLAPLLEEYPSVRVQCTDTGNQKDLYKALVWDGPVYKTVEPLTSWGLKPLLIQVYQCVGMVTPDVLMG